MTERDSIISMISDQYKDAHGFRPRHINFDAMSTQELEVYSDELQIEVLRSIAQQEEAEQLHTKEFEATVQKTILNGAGDRETALRWMAQAEGEVQDMGYLCYLFGIPYTYEAELTHALGI